MKLELKQLAPYLPYGVKIYDENRFFMGMDFAIMNTHGGTNYEAVYNVINYNMKLILNPLSSMSDNLFANMGYADEDDLKLAIEEGLVSYFTTTQLIMNHFDVFGLIEKGLAIDLKTIQS